MDNRNGTIREYNTLKYVSCEVTNELNHKKEVIKAYRIKLEYNEEDSSITILTYYNILKKAIWEK